MNKRKLYSQISLDFRRLSTNLIRADYTDVELHLKRFRNYIYENEIVSGIIQDKIKNSSYDYKNDFITTSDSSLKYVNAPENESDHLRAIYDYIIELCTYKDLRDIAIAFHYTTSTKWTDIVRAFLEKAIKPLIDFIIDSLSKEMIILEEEIKDKININYNQGQVNISKDNSKINSTQNINNRLLNGINTTKLVEELNTLKEKLVEKEMYFEAGIVKNAIETDQANERIEFLKQLGNNVLEVAQEIHLPISTTALTKCLGLIQHE